MKIEIGVTGKIVTGTVSDVNRRSFERKLADFDPQLHLVWNPQKRQGMGCWQIFRRPDKKRFVLKAVYQGTNFYELEYERSALVREVAFLTYRVIDDMRSKDINRIFNRKPEETDEAFMLRVHHETEARKAAYEADIMRRADEDQAYMIKQHKREIKDFKEMVLSGFNPARIAQYWGHNS